MKECSSLLISKIGKSCGSPSKFIEFCRSGILDGEYVFKGCEYQKEFCKMLYESGTSIQAIRDYMGYATDERVKEYIGWQDERIAKASHQYFLQENHSLGDAALMAKHDKMNEVNRQESERKIEMALQEVKSASDKGKSISVSELSRRTGLSTGFFYKNEQVRAALDAAKYVSAIASNRKFTKIWEAICARS